MREYMKPAIQATVQRSPLTALLVLIFFTLSACSGGSHDLDPRKNEISGVILAPAVYSASLSGTSLFARALGVLFSASIADVTGLSPLPNVQVELVRLDSQGDVSSVLLTTTANSLGEYTFTTSLQPDSTLAVRIQNPELSYNYALVTTSPDTDITPVTDAVYDTVTQEIAGSGGSVILENFTVDESAALVAMVDGLDIDVSSAPTLDDAVNQVTTASGPTLTNMVSNFATPSQSATIHDKDFYLTSTYTTLHDPFALGGAGNGGIGIAFDRGYGTFATTPAINGNSFYDPIFHNLGTVASTQDQYLNRSGTNYVVNSTNQLIVSNPDATTTVGFTLSDGTLLVYPVGPHSAVAGEMYGHGLEISVGNEWGDASIATIAAAWGNTIHNEDKKDANILNGSFNLVQLDGRLASQESLAAANQTAMQISYGTVTFTPDSGWAFGTLATGTLTTSQVSLDVDTYTVSNTSASDSYTGRYEIGGSGYLTIDDPRTGYTFLQGNMAFNKPIAFLAAAKDIYAAEIDDVLDSASDAAGDTLSVNSIDTTGTTGTVVLNNDNSISYTPLASATGTDSFDYTVSDGSLTSTATVTINLTSGNATPVATADNVSVNTGATNVQLNVLINDTDAVGETLTIDSIDTTGTTGSAAVNTDNKTISYTPAGAGADSFTYTVSDGVSISSAATVSITAAANAAPTATADNLAVNTGAVNVTLDVLANDSDAAGDSMTIDTFDITGTSGTVTKSGDSKSFIYTPAGAGADSFTYTVTDGTLTSSQATVSITVAANTAPTANPVSYSINNDNEGQRNLAVIIKQGSAMSNADVTGTYSIVEYRNGFNDTGTTGIIDSSTRQGTLVFDGLGTITGGTLHQRMTSMDVDVAQAASASSLTVQPTGATPDSPAGGSVYTVNADGTLDMTLIIGSETITGHGAVTADGQLISIVLETNNTGVSGSRGLMLLSRQP